MENRKELILKEIVDKYIETGEPISSQMLLEEYNLSFSSATIRNDMHALEEEGYVKKPYTSGGRIPTRQGYKYFVDWLIELSQLTSEERKEIVSAYNFERQDAGRLLQMTVMLLANITDYASFVLGPDLDEARLENFTLVQLDSNHLMAIFVTEWGLVENRILRLKREIPSKELNQISPLLNEKLRGKKLKDMKKMETLNLEEGGWYDKLMRDSLLLIKQFLDEEPERRLFLEGTLNLIEQVNPQNKEQLDQLKAALGFIQDQKKVNRVLSECKEDEKNPVAMVGIESDEGRLDYSLVAKRLADCSSALGVIGPLRMDYSKSFSAVQYIGSRLTALLTVGNPNVESRG